MTLEQIIRLFQEVENDVEGQKLGFHLHKSIAQANKQSWHTNDTYPDTFSGFLEALRDAEAP